MREEMRKVTSHVTLKTKIDVLKYEPDDNRILECAVEANSQYIVTEDKDPLRLQEYNGIKIVTAAQFLRVERGS